MFEAELKKLNAAAHSTASTLGAGRQAGGGGGGGGVVLSTGTEESPRVR